MSGEKTEQPTQKRLEDRRKEGQLPQRRNVVEAVYLTLSVLLLAGLSGSLSEGLIGILTTAADAISEDFPSGLRAVATASGPILVLTLGFTVAGAGFVLVFGLLLNRFNFSAKALTPKFQKLNPVSGLKNLFSKSTLYNFLRLTAYFIVLSLVLYFSISLNIRTSETYAYCTDFCIFRFFAALITVVVLIILATLGVLAAIDFRIQSALFRSQNKMSKDEVKREHKTQEGDPQVKGARKSTAFEDAVMPGPRDATHVVYSDTFLVAFIYREETRTSPYVIAKVRGPHAPRVAEKYRALGKAVVNLPAVAFDFYPMAKPWHYMPPRSAAGLSKILQTLS